MISPPPIIIYFCASYSQPSPLPLPPLPPPLPASPVFSFPRPMIDAKASALEATRMQPVVSLPTASNCVTRAVMSEKRKQCPDQSMRISLVQIVTTHAHWSIFVSSRIFCAVILRCHLISNTWIAFPAKILSGIQVLLLFRSNVYSSTVEWNTMYGLSYPMSMQEQRKQVGEILYFIQYYNTLL